MVASNMSRSKAASIVLVICLLVFLAYLGGTNQILPQRAPEIAELPQSKPTTVRTSTSKGVFITGPTYSSPGQLTTTKPPTQYVVEISEHISQVKKNRDCLGCQSQKPVKVFCAQYPGQYGCPSYVMVGVRLRNKPGYVKFTSSILRKYNNVPIGDIHLFDDASASFDANKLKEWYGKDVKYFRSDKEIGLAATTRKIFEQFSTSAYEVLLILDSDMVLLKNWFTFLEDHVPLTDGILSLYHPSRNHSYVADCDTQEGDLCLSDSVSTSGVAITKAIAKAILGKSKEFNPEVGWKKLLGDESVKCYYPPRSLAMRIGQENQDADNCGENEPPYRFNRCEYPMWIQNQIEFYFDRCTSPDEIYPDNPDSDEFQEKLRKRYWARPAITYSLYGSRARYIAIGLGNAARVSSIYPGWKMWIYYEDSVPDPYLQKFCEYDVRLIDMTGVTSINKMSWRFLVGSEPVKMYAVRDIDSYLLPRGKAAVDEWIASGRKFHVLRDHPNHSAHPISGGMWGGTHDAMPNIKQELEKYTSSNAYMVDMNFLRQIVWPIAQKSAWVNDAHSIHKYGEDHPFPTKQKDRSAFVGNVILWP